MNDILKRLALITAPFVVLALGITGCAETGETPSEPGDKFVVTSDQHSGIADIYVVIDRDTGCHYLLTDLTDAPLVERRWPDGTQVCREDQKTGAQ